MSNKKGNEYEHDLSNEIAEETNLVPLGGGYNGMSSYDIDMLIDDGEAVHVFELKKTSQDAYTLFWENDDRRKDDLFGLLKFCVNYPRPAYPYGGVRFNRKELLISKLFVELWPDRDEVLKSGTLTVDCEDCVSVTRADNLRFKKTDAIPSQSSGNDVQAVLDAIGYTL